jgi:hypothetical protein
MKLEFPGQRFEKYLNTKFDENPSRGSRVVPCGRADRQADRQTDMTELLIDFRSFVSARNLNNVCSITNALSLSVEGQVKIS